jgi:hypothetical protein
VPDQFTTGNAVCAWCGVDLGPRPALAPGQVSHGICEGCSLLEFGECVSCGKPVEPGAVVCPDCHLVGL